MTPLKAHYRQRCRVAVTLLLATVTLLYRCYAATGYCYTAKLLLRCCWLLLRCHAAVTLLLAAITLLYCCYAPAGYCYAAILLLRCYWLLLRCHTAAGCYYVAAALLLLRCCWLMLCCCCALFRCCCSVVTLLLVTAPACPPAPWIGSPRRRTPDPRRPVRRGLFLSPLYQPV